MAISSERTVWAEGMGYSVEEVEALTLIYEAAYERGFDGELPAGDLTSWACSLERAELDDLAAKVRELPSYC